MEVSRMRILILGAGAVGGYFGARLMQAGADVTFLVRTARRRVLETAGLIVKSPYGDAHLAPKLLGAGEAAPAFDLILLSCKAYDLQDAMAAIAPFTGERTLIVPLLNGVAHLDALRARFGDARLCGGFAGIGATLGPDGDILHFDRNNFIGFGPLAGATPATLDELARLFAATPAQATLSTEIAVSMWAKYAFLATLAAATCLMRASVGVILDTPIGADLISDLYAEALAIAAAAGFSLSEARMEGYRAHLFQRGSGSTASMLRDIERGGKTENAHILGHMVALAARHALPAPRLALAHSHVLAYEMTRGHATLAA
jgi:2-dehydropantoate 2-reductase